MAFLTEADRKYTTPEDICAHLGDEYGKFCGAMCWTSLWHSQDFAD